MNFKVHEATIEDIQLLVPLIQELRPHLSSEEINILLPKLFSEGYKIAFIANNNEAYAFIGFRIHTFLFSGKTLYIDDLVTLSSQQKNGFATVLFNWIKVYAKEQQCDHLSLDSGFQRRDAYRFYLNQGLFVESMHFGRKVEEL